MMWLSPLTSFPEKVGRTSKMEFDKSSQTSIRSSLRTKKQRKKLPQASNTSEERRRTSLSQAKPKEDSRRKRALPLGLKQSMKLLDSQVSLTTSREASSGIAAQGS